MVDTLAHYDTKLITDVNILKYRPKDGYKLDSIHSFWADTLACSSTKKLTLVKCFISYSYNDDQSLIGNDRSISLMQLCVFCLLGLRCFW